MVSYLFGLESMCYLTTGLVDRGVHDYSLESAICKVAGTEFLWYQANRALQLAGGEGYMRTEPYEKILRDIRIFPIFEGANDVLRSFVALYGMKPLGEKLIGPRRHRAQRPDRLARRAGRLRRRPHPARGRPDKITKAHHELCSATPTRSPTRSSSCATSARRCSASTAGDRRPPVPPEAPRRRRRRHLRPDRRALDASPRSSTTTASSPRARSATSRTPSAPAPRAACASQLRPDRAQRRRAHDRDRQARLQARRVRLRAVRRLAGQREDG